MRVLFALAAILLLDPCSGLAETGFPLVSVFSAEDMRLDGAKWTTVQAPDGTLILGGDALLTYDGARWQQTLLEGAYALRGLDFGADGRLWVAATGELGWFERGATGGRRFTSLRAHLPDRGAEAEEIWNVFALEHGAAVFVSSSRVLRWDGARFSVWDLPGVRRLFAMRHAGSIYVYHPPTGLHEVTAEGLRLVVPAGEFDGAAPAALERDGERWLFATSRGLLIREAGGTASRLSDDATADLLRRGRITSAVRLSSGDWAIGTFAEGLAILRSDGTLRRLLTEQDGLPSNRVYSLFVDRNDGLWVTTASQVCRISLPSASAVFDRRSDLPAPPVLKVAPLGDSVAVATEAGVHRLDPENGGFAPLAVMPATRVWDLRGGDSDLVIASVRGVMQWTQQGVKELYRARAGDAFATGRSRRWPETYLVSEAHRIIRINEAGETQALVDDLPDIATSLCEDGAGRLWIGTYTRGVLVADLTGGFPVHARPAGEADGLPANLRDAILIGDAGGGIAVLAATGGWGRTAPPRRFTAIDGYPARAPAAASQLAADGSFWVVHPATEDRPATVGRVALNGRRFRYEPQAVEGLATIGMPRALAVTRSRGEEVLWIGGSTALLRHEPGRARPVAPPARPLVRFTARDRDGSELAAGVRLPSTVHTVRFDLALPEFASPQSFRLETRLVDVDPGWIPATPAAGREMTMLRHGKFCFQARAVTETGLSGDVAEVWFQVAPPWWRRTDVQTLAFVLALGAAYAAYRWRVRALHRRNAELETRVHERTEQLARANAAKTEFVAGMSHDIRNPLNGIVGLTLALEQGPLRSEQRTKVGMLRECAAYLSSLVEDVLDFASIEAGKVEIKSVSYSPQQILVSVATILRADADEHGASFQIELDETLPQGLLGDPDRIRQIVMNYATNALKYAGGSIRIAARRAGHDVEFSVEDRGPGLDEAQIAQLFTRFTRLKAAGKFSAAGTGLGLASCRLLAGRMGGDVGVVSTPGQGSRFYARFHARPAPASPVIEAAGTRPLRVLVVEDADYNAEATRAVLARLGHESERVRTGSEAVARFATAAFDVILMDRNLPDIDGLEATRRIRHSGEAGHQVTILAVTAYCTEADRQLCEAAGMDAFVGKPLTPEKLRQGLQAATRRFLPSPPMSEAGVETEARPEPDLSLLAYLGGNDIGAAVERLLGEIDSSQAELTQRQGAIAKALAGLAAEAHRMISHAHMVGADDVAAAATRLEDAARLGQADEIDACWRQLVADVEKLRAALKTRSLPGRD